MILIKTLKTFTFLLIYTFYFLYKELVEAMQRTNKQTNTFVGLLLISAPVKGGWFSKLSKGYFDLKDENQRKNVQNAKKTLCSREL